jgi:hypothetical protein
MVQITHFYHLFLHFLLLIWKYHWCLTCHQPIGASTCLEKSQTKWGPNQHHKLNISWFNNGNCAKFVHHNLYLSHINIVNWKHIWNKDFLEDAKSMWHSFIHRFVFPSSNLSCVKRIFNAWCSCIKCTNVWMNKLHMIFIIILSHAKFVMKASKVCLTSYTMPLISMIC